MADERVFSWPFVLCAVANFLQSLAFNLYLHLPGFLKEIGAGEVQIGLIFGLTAAVAITVRPWVGRTMDAHGRRVVILAGGVINVGVCLLYVTVGGLGPWVYAVRVVHGVAEAMLFAAFFTLAADLVPPSRRTEGLAIFGVSTMLPISLGGVLGDLILARADYPVLFVTAAGLGAASLCLSVPLQDREQTHGGPPARGFFASVVQRDLVPLWFIGTVFALAIASYFTFLKTFVMETGAGSVGGFFSAYAAAAISLRVFFTWLPERVGSKPVLFASLATLASGMLLLSRALTANEVVVAGGLCGLGHGLVFPILTALVVTRARPRERGVALSIYTALFDAGVLIGGPMLGGVIRVAGYPAMFVTAAVIVLVGAVVFAVWDRESAGRARRESR